eukprot:CAMPEP_0194131470 /NCGR_PEP_ID=MMETSP0152-20130528/2242_1 /TAXON_ID=1049557 /ORGANISM="Thalassiothrix antarctica, Strain L6-D1" /LENGTH=30 /DNA_ID= /DNA_START= /DNA_END= /DNA_ORIENTATION=
MTTSPPNTETILNNLSYPRLPRINGEPTLD